MKDFYVSLDETLGPRVLADTPEEAARKGFSMLGAGAGVHVYVRCDVVRHPTRSDDWISARVREFELTWEFLKGQDSPASPEPTPQAPAAQAPAEAPAPSKARKGKAAQEAAPPEAAPPEAAPPEAAPPEAAS